ncbi:hypothetical protein [Archangium violaceum]|uniref:hypothetical protein n=1 Tax=Archangium violaceum TaxID=83451 RepID=UPI0036DB3944
MLHLESLTVDALTEASLADVVESLVAREPAAFRERLNAFDMARLTRMTAGFEHTYGWRPPEELVSWRAIELALDLDNDPECIWKSDDLSLGLQTYPDALGASEEEQRSGAFLPPSAEVLFAGLFRLTEDASGDRTLASLLPDPLGHIRVHAYGHEFGTLGEPQSLKSFLLTTWLSEMEPGEGPDRPGQVGLERFEELLGVADAVDARLESVRRDQQPPDFPDSSALHARSRWLMDPLWGHPGPSLAKELAQAPDLAVWDTELPRLPNSPLLANYWMVAHYFLGNDTACALAVEQGARAHSEPTRWIAQLISRFLAEPGQASLGRTGPQQLAALRQQVRAAARPSQLTGR